MEQQSVSNAGYYFSIAVIILKVRRDNIFGGEVKLLRVSHKDILTVNYILKWADFSEEVMITCCLPQKKDKSFATLNRS